MVRNHPAVGQVNFRLELNGNQFSIDLHDSTLQPTLNTLIAFLVVAKSFNCISDLIAVG